MRAPRKPHSDLPARQAAYQHHRETEEDAAEARIAALTGRARTPGSVETSAGWLDVDLAGWRPTLTARLHRILMEPISNAFDTEATTVTVEFTQADGRGTLIVADNDPDGFAALRDAWTLFAPSTRKHDPTKRGRFGQGEKELIAICSGGGRIYISTTTGTVHFDETGRHVESVRRPSGSLLEATFRCNQAQAAKFDRAVRRMIPPAGVTVTYNGEPLVRPQPVAAFRWSLETVNADDDGHLRSRTRQTDVELFEPAAGDKPSIYELGVFVVNHDSRFTVNVAQKVPLNRDRDNVKPAYLRAIREAILDHAAERLTQGDMKKGWVMDALPAARPDVLRHVVETVHGKDAVIYDPSNREATKMAVDQGRTVIYGRSFPTAVWDRIREDEVVKPAGQVIQTGVPTDADGKPPIPEERWTDAMIDLARYAEDVGMHLLGYAPSVEFADVAVAGASGEYAAWFGGKTLTVNLHAHSRGWPETVTEEHLDALLIHEFAHDKANDHLHASFYGECCRLGAKLRSCPARLRT